MDTFWVPSVAFCFGVAVTLTSSLRSRNIVSGAYLLFYLRRGSKLSVLIHLWVAECHTPFSDHCDLDLWSPFYEYLVFGGICQIVTHFLFLYFLQLIGTLFNRNCIIYLMYTRYINGI